MTLLVRLHTHDVYGQCVEMNFPVYRPTSDNACRIRNYALTVTNGLDAGGEVWPLEVDEDFVPEDFEEESDTTWGGYDPAEDDEEPA